MSRAFNDDEVGQGGATYSTHGSRRPVAAAPVVSERGVPVTYLVADDEGHGFANPENRKRLNRAVERHFAEHLGGRRAEGDT